jgi:hypothetical protein
VRSPFTEVARKNRRWALAVLYCDVHGGGTDKTGTRGGNTDKIIALLEGNARLTRGARLLLADLLRRSSLTPKQGRPRKPLYDAMTSHQLRAAWAAEKVRTLMAKGIDRDKAVREVVESKEPPITENALRNALRRGVRLPR